MFKLQIELIENLSTSDAIYGVDWRISREATSRRGESPWVERLCERLKKTLGSKIAEDYADHLRRWKQGDEWPDASDPFDPQHRLLRPEKWLIEYNGGWKDLLLKLEKEAASNINISNACAFFCLNLILSTSYSDEVEIVVALGKSHREYLAFFWNCALMLDSSDHRYQGLLSRRARANESGLFPAEFLDEHFPLPSDNSKNTLSE